MSLACSKNHKEPNGRGKDWRADPENLRALSDAKPTIDESEPNDPLIVVAICVSAGFVPALSSFFEATPQDLGVAFLVVGHFSREHQTALPKILSASTPMPIVLVRESVRMNRNRVYVSPDVQMAITDDGIATLAREQPHGARNSIDFFFRSLAKRHGGGLVVILSGGGSDGTAGLKAIKDAGGVVMVQDPYEAENPAMPSAAIASRLADVVLPVRALADRLAELIRARHRRS